MKYDKHFLRKKYSLLRKKNFYKKYKFPFYKIFKVIYKHHAKKIPNIAGYYPSNFEVNILNFLENASKKNFRILLPTIKKANDMSFRVWKFKAPLQINKFGMPEPSKQNKELIPDIILVPLMVFDRQLNRVGYGGGYYDRVLAKMGKINKKVTTIGIAYSFQEYRNIPVNKHDFKLNYIFTENGFINSKN